MAIFRRTVLAGPTLVLVAMASGRGAPSYAATLFYLSTSAGLLLTGNTTATAWVVSTAADAVANAPTTNPLTMLRLVDIRQDHLVDHQVGRREDHPEDRPVATAVRPQGERARHRLGPRHKQDPVIQTLAVVPSTELKTPNSRQGSEVNVRV